MLVRKVIITNAALSDSVVFEELLDLNNASHDSGRFPILARLISGKTHARLDPYNQGFGSRQ